MLYLDDLSRSDFLSLLRGAGSGKRLHLLDQKPYRPASIKAAQRLGLCVVENSPRKNAAAQHDGLDNLAIMLVGRVRGLWFGGASG